MVAYIYIYIYVVIFNLLILQCTHFRVPNIKFNVAKVLQSLIPIVDQSVCTAIFAMTGFTVSSTSLYLNNFMDYIFHVLQVAEKTIRPCLVELAEDPDVDVRHFATQALQSIDNVMMSS